MLEGVSVEVRDDDDVDDREDDAKLQLVAPILVTVFSKPPSLTVFLPVSQLQVSSPAQQYWTLPVFSLEHLMSGSMNWPMQN